MDPRHVSETSHYLRHLADDVECDSGARYTLGDIADRLRELADQQLIALPTIDPHRDDLRRWAELSPHRLRTEVHADAWRLAAGITVTRDRAATGKAAS